LIQFLIAKQNEFLEISPEARGNIAIDGCSYSDWVVPLHLLQEEHLISFDESYIEKLAIDVAEPTVGYGVTIDNYNFDRLENTLIQRFIVGKPKLSNSTKLMDFRDNVIGDFKMKLDRKIRQQELPLGKESVQINSILTSLKILRREY
jgi:hypothetical protein